MSLLYRTIQSHIKDFESNLYTSIPAKVVSFDPTECTVEVQPSINEIDADGIVRVLPELGRVPILMPSSFNSALTFPVKEGDKVLLHFSHSNIEDYLLQSTESDSSDITPKTKRKHDLDDCFATLGVRFYDDTPVKREDTLDMYFNESRITIKDDGDITITNEKEGSSVVLSSDGNIDITTKSKLTINNDSIELISLLSELVNTLANTTVNTYYGPTPLNSKSQLQNLKSQLDTMKV